MSIRTVRNWLFYQTIYTFLSLTFLLVLVALHMEESSTDNDQLIRDILVILREPYPTFQNLTEWGRFD